MRAGTLDYIDPTVPRPFPRTLVCAINFAWRFAAVLGQGHNGLGLAHNGLNPPVVPPCCGGLQTFSMGWQRVTTPQRLKHPPSYDRTHACACEGYVPLCRCAVVPSFYLFETKRKKKERGHNGAHNARKIWPLTVVGGVVGWPLIWPKSLESNKKGGFLRG